MKSELFEVLTVLAILSSLSFELIGTGQAIAKAHECDDPSTDSEIQYCVESCQIPCEQDDILNLDCSAVESRCGFKLYYVGGVK